jgi:hypothetical protein
MTSSGSSGAPEMLPTAKTSSRLHLYASLPHFADHLTPIWQALPEAVRGEAWTARAGQPWGHRPDARELHRTRAEPVMVASLADAQRMHPRPLIYVEHGAGQSYDGDPRGSGHGSYSGGAGLDRVLLFLTPGEATAARWRATYRAPAVAVGCPMLDRFHRSPRDVSRGAATVAVTFHWDCPLLPETRTALPHYRAALDSLRASVEAHGGRLLGHGHPRASRTMEALWKALGVQWMPRLADVLAEADLLVADNTSAAYEFASLDRPVLMLNAPWYRRDVHHGLRFWNLVPGLQVDHPDELVPGVWTALADGPVLTGVRHQAVAAVYCATDGHAADRAAAAILEVLNAEPEGPPRLPAGV